MRAPWWFCCGWRSYWCVLDTVMHALRIKVGWVCRRHDRWIQREDDEGVRRYVSELWAEDWDSPEDAAWGTFALVDVLWIAHLLGGRS